MKPVPMQPNLPEATTALGTVVKPKRWIECQKCKKLSPLEEREWQGLTDDEIYEAIENSNSVLVKDMARSIEAKLKEKNA